MADIPFVAMMAEDDSGVAVDARIIGGEDGIDGGLVAGGDTVAGEVADDLIAITAAPWAGAEFIDEETRESNAVGATTTFAADVPLGGADGFKTVVIFIFTIAHHEDAGLFKSHATFFENATVFDTTGGEGGDAMEGGAEIRHNGEGAGASFFFADETIKLLGAVVRIGVNPTHIEMLFVVAVHNVGGLVIGGFRRGVFIHIAATKGKDGFGEVGGGGVGGEFDTVNGFAHSNEVVGGVAGVVE